MNKKVLWILLAAVLMLFAACSDEENKPQQSNESTIVIGDHNKADKLRILSGSENKELQPLLEEFANKHQIALEMHYLGSLDIMRVLQRETIDYDAVWPASSLWISLGDEKHRVKHSESISVTPVVFGIKKSLAQQLGFVDKEVSIREIMEAIRSGKLRFAMTSATQSNSGASAYLGFLNALAGSPDVLTMQNLSDPSLKASISGLLSGVQRSSGSSEWLKSMFLEGDYDAMVNYESLILTTNEELVKQGREPLYIIYPHDGISLSDAPLAYVDHGDAKKETTFLALQEFLLSDENQKKIQGFGRRTGFEGVAAENQSLFKAEWGASATRTLSPIKTPQADVIREALNLYQTEFKKPSLTVYVIDFSGSMKNEGEKQVKEAMSQILVQQNAQLNLLQASDREVNIVIPFDSRVRSVDRAVGNRSEIETLFSKVDALQANGGTDMYGALVQALSELKKENLSDYTPAIIVMSDGMSETNQRGVFMQAYKNSGLDVPVFSIMFASADPDQLEELAKLTNARVFDGRSDLIDAFKKVKGYN